MLSTLASAAGLAKAKKKFRFDVIFSLEDLKNSTFVSGVIFAKVRLKDGGNFSVISESSDIKSHCVEWNQKFEFHCKMYASPVTGELEPCYCKVSIRKETKGGRSYKKLGYVKINLAEYAGAGETQRKYLVESYNENKHKPDNSILGVTISLKLTSGDSVFKAPQAPDCRWEISEAPEDEGIQPDIQPRHSYSSRTSTSSSFSHFHPGVEGNTGGSLQDVCQREGAEVLSRQRRTNSTFNLGRPSSDLRPSDILEESSSKSETTPPGSNDETPRNLSPILQKSLDKKQRSNSVEKESRSDPDPSPLAIDHRRMGSWSQASNGVSPHLAHRRQQSLVSGSSKSTSAYSTLSERSGGSLEAVAVESGSLRGHLAMLSTNSKMEESRVDPKAVIDNLFSGHNFSSSETELGGGGLQIYFHKNTGSVTLAGPNLDRKNTDLQAFDVSEHKRRRRKDRHSSYKESPSRETSPSDLLPQTDSGASSSNSSTKTVTDNGP